MSKHRLDIKTSWKHRSQRCWFVCVHSVDFRQLVEFLQPVHNVEGTVRVLLYNRNVCDETDTLLDVASHGRGAWLPDA